MSKSKKVYFKKKFDYTMGDVQTAKDFVYRNTDGNSCGESMGQIESLDAQLSDTRLALARLVEFLLDGNIISEEQVYEIVGQSKS